MEDAANIPGFRLYQAHAAKFVSKTLKRFVREQPYVIESSQSLCRELRNLRLPRVRGQKIYLVTGDLEAFYPNVPLQRTVAMIAEMLRANLNQGGEYRWDLDLCADLLPLINAHLGFTFEGTAYTQRDGIVMGIACSPDFANLFAASCENSVIPNLKAKGVLYYKRYIDDMFAVVQAESLSDALSKIPSDMFSPVKLIMSGSEVMQDYLDVTVSINPILYTVETRPYRKSMSHHERVPWVSSHPYDVKKGTYISELSRLAHLSSQKSYYQDAVHDANVIYMARGYPPRILVKWSKEHLNRIWAQSRSSKTESHGEETRLWVIKTHFNPALEYVNVQELQTAIETEWRKGIAQAESDEVKALDELSRETGIDQTELPTDASQIATAVLGRRLLFSRRATIKLGTLMNSWSQKVLAQARPEVALDLIEQD